MSTNPESRAWLRLRADALRENYLRIRDSVGSAVGVIPMVKADGYGLGVGEVVAALTPLGPWGWGVATAAEGLELRDAGVTEPVLVLTPLPPDDVVEAVRAGLQLSLSSLDALARVSAAAAEAGSTASVHIDVDTGMGRSGFDGADAEAWLPRLIASLGEHVALAGCFTHLHSAEDDRASIQAQWDRFQKVLAALPERPPLVHVLNSAGAFTAPEYALDAVRPGIFLYGGAVGPGHAAPSPVVSLHARVCHVRDAVAGTSLGYGATYRASGPERWATLSVGYGDGLPRALGNRGSALVAGQRVPIIGRISMDLTVVDITDVAGVGVGDVATLLGAAGRDEITLDEVAGLAGTISYEILTGFTRRLPRVWT